MANVAILVTLEQILRAIRSLPVAERSALIKTLNQDISPHAASVSKPHTEVEPADFIGFLSEDPDLAEEIKRIGTVERECEDMRAWGDAEGRS